jgi:hypothetical protein
MPRVASCRSAPPSPTATTCPADIASIFGRWPKARASRSISSARCSPVELPDKEHDGHSGWKIEEVDAITVDPMTTYLPHILLVHVGTNDVRGGDDVTLILDRLRALVDTMTSTDPQVVVVLASLAPLADATDQLAVDALNAEVPTIVQDNQTANQHVVFADIAAALTAADLEDGIHPTAAGYDKMGTVWFDAIASMLP